MNRSKITVWLFCGAIFAAGALTGWWLSGRRVAPGPAPGDLPAEAAQVQVWTCSMHPQIRQEKPGKCPLCAMDLIPVKTGGTGAGVDPDAIQLSEEALALARVQTTTVSRARPVKEMRLYGVIQPNERLLRSQVSHVSGRIENLAVNTVGAYVRSGQVIATIYSPELLSAQQELLEAKKWAAVQPALLNAAREKLRLWKLTEEQIAGIEQSGTVSPTVSFTADFSGIVTAKRVEQGDYAAPGSVLFELADLSSVWAVFDAYESDLPYLRMGDAVEFTLSSLPGEVFSGNISFIEPVVDKIARTAKIRVETANPRLELKPGMYAGAVVRSALKSGGEELVIPRTAVLWTGKRSIVYVKQPHTEMPAFKLREIELGASPGSACVVLSGLGEGEEIVTNGAFAIDASAQLEGKRSMMNTGAAAAKTEHAVLPVQGLCDMCKETIETAARGVAGVSSAVWDRESRQLHLHFDPAAASLEAIGKAVAKVGYDNGKSTADDRVYNALPACCQYRVN